MPLQSHPHQILLERQNVILLGNNNYSLVKVELHRIRMGPNSMAGILTRRGDLDKETQTQKVV